MLCPRRTDFAPPKGRVRRSATAPRRYVATIPTLKAFNLESHVPRDCTTQLWRFNMSFKTGASAAALALTLGLTAAAAQQQVSPPAVQPEKSRTPMADQIVTQPENSILARDLIGQTVTAPDNTKIGNISDLVMSKDGRTVEGFVIGVGGFLGIGEREVAVSFESLHLDRGTDQRTTATLNATKDTLKAAPEWKWSATKHNSPSGMGTTPTR